MTPVAKRGRAGGEPYVAGPREWEVNGRQLRLEAADWAECWQTMAASEPGDLKGPSDG
jgi:hypothetical protein